MSLSRKSKIEFLNKWIEINNKKKKAGQDGLNDTLDLKNECYQLGIKQLLKK